MPVDGRALVGGTARATKSGHEVRDPYRDQTVASVHLAGKSEVDDAVRAAHEGHIRMARTPLHERIGLFEKVIDLIGDRQEQLAEMISRQTGKAIKDSRVEVLRSQRTIRAAISAMRELRGEVVAVDASPGGEGLQALVRREPLGVAAAITPFNSPFNIPMHKVASALITGNAAILKPALQAPITGLQLGEVFLDAGFPPEAISVLPGGAETGAALASAHGIDVVSFTGGVAGGNAVAREAGAKPLLLELGGNSANIVCRDADLQVAARQLVTGAYAVAGQTCNSVQRVIVDRAVEPDLVDLLAKLTEDLVVGDPLDEKTDIGTLIDEAAAIRVEEWINEASRNGVEVMTDFQRNGASLTPVVLRGVTPDMRIAQDEVFGPVMAVMTADSLAESIEIANQAPFGLQASVFTRRLDNAMRAARDLKAGGIMVNRSSKTRFDHLPFGGVKASGFGREGGSYSLEAFTYRKFVLIDAGIENGD